MRIIGVFLMAIAVCVAAGALGSNDPMPFVSCGGATLIFGIICFAVGARNAPKDDVSNALLRDDRPPIPTPTAAEISKAESPAAKSTAKAAWVIVALLSVALLVGGYFAYQAKSRADAAAAEKAAMNAESAKVDAMIRGIQEQIDFGKQHHIAALGMTADDVQEFKGMPYDKQGLYYVTDAEKAQGGVEKWVYRAGQQADGEILGWVLFREDRRVIASSDWNELRRRVGLDK